MKHLTIGYITSRIQPRIEWFFNSLANLLPGSIRPKLIIVDLQAGVRKDRSIPSALREKLSDAMWIEPKPSVWHGRFRLTKCDFFSAANCRNTVLALAPDGYVAMVDDLSVLTEAWFNPITELMESNSNHVICGSFQKVMKLKVDEAGRPTSFETYQEGIDPRWVLGHDKVDVACAPQWLFGCSLCGPVDQFLAVNGYPEALCDGMGYEDCIMGATMAVNGSFFRYSRRMKTLESEEDHHNQPALLRYDPGVSPDDKSHAILSLMDGQSFFPQSFGDRFPTLSDLRSHLLNGGKFPIRKEPIEEWFTKIPIDQFHLYKSGALFSAGTGTYKDGAPNWLNELLKRQHQH